MNKINKISTFLLVWLVFTAFIFFVLAVIGLAGAGFGLIAEVPYSAFALVAGLTGLLCAVIGVTERGVNK